MAKNRNLFNAVRVKTQRKNVFDLTHDVKLSCKMGRLVPIMAEEAIPGDKWRIGCESMIRFAPMIAPVMHRFDVTMHYFFVPNRLLWDGWEDWIVNSGDAKPFPYISISDVNHGGVSSLADYMGIPVPPAGANAENVSAFPFAAYQMIYNEYYRDQNVINPVDFALVDGNNVANSDLLELRRRAWEHDYFTSALPWAQKGDGVDVPLGDVRLKDDWYGAGTRQPHFQDYDGTFHQGPVEQLNAPDPYISINDGGSNTVAAYDPDGTLETTPTTINELRRAFKLQEWLEKAARGGTRYIEFVRSMFGVHSSDKRMQRPEYITGIKNPIQISEVLNTSDTANAPQGNMAGHGIGYTKGNYGSYYCEEHGWVIGIMSVMPKTAYMQGIEKKFLKIDDPFQFFWPEFAHIGEQEVLKKELYAFQGGTGAGTFGYVPRYAEYKFANNRVSGEFRTASMNHWHAGRLFLVPPQLNEEFISADPTKRIFAVIDEDEDELYCHVLNHVRAVRPMPVFGTPTL